MKVYYEKAFGYLIFFYPLVRTLVYPLAPRYISYRGALFIDFDESLSIAPPFSCFFSCFVL